VVTTPTAAHAAKPVDTERPTTSKSASLEWEDKIQDDLRDLSWAAVLKRTFEAYIRGERPNMYGEWINWS